MTELVKNDNLKLQMSSAVPITQIYSDQHLLKAMKLSTILMINLRLLLDASKCYFWLSILTWHKADWHHVLSMLDCPCKAMHPTPHPPTGYLANGTCCLAYFSLLFGNGVYQWNTNLRTTYKHTISNKTSVPQ